MSASVPVLAPAFAPDERPEPDETAKAKAKEGRTRTGRHEPIRSSTPRIAYGVDGANARSVAVMRRLGFRLERNLHPDGAGAVVGVLDNDRA